MAADFFSFVGLPRRLQIDGAALDERYRALSREYHPDYFCDAPPAERRASLERSSYLNDAYRTLKNPIARVEYLLRLEGCAPSAAGDTAPPALLEEVFALNEELDEVRALKSRGAPRAEWMRRLDAARAPIEQRRAGHERELLDLSSQWDALAENGSAGDAKRAVLDALRERLLERNYIRNLLAGIERELAGP
jgi:molecular chaperone HscB